MKIFYQISKYLIRKYITLNVIPLGMLWGCLFSAEWVTVDTTLSFSTATSMDQARIETLALCRKLAIKKVVPQSIEVYSHFYRNQTENNDYYKDITALSSFVISANSGLIVDEKIIKGKPIVMDNSSSFDYQMTLKARIEAVEGERDPTIYIKLWVDQNNLKSGDALVLHAESSIDGYLYLFWFYADNSVAMLFPNEYSKNNRVFKNHTLNIPSEREQKNGLAYRVAGLSDRDISVETVYAVLTKQKVANVDELIQIGTDLQNNLAGEKSYTDFQQWLSRTPLSQRDEKALQITISKD
jgi:hypothetical protein